MATNEPQKQEVPTGYPVPGQPPLPPQTGYPYPPQNYGGTAYQYPPQPPQPQPYVYQSYNPYYDRPTNTSVSNASRFFRFVIIGIISFFILSALITLITYLVLHPQLPTFSITSAKVSSFNLSSSQLTSNFNFDVFVTNPNKKISLYYDNLDADVLYRSNSISTTSLPPFSQTTGNTTNVTVRFAAVEVYVSGDVADAILKNKGTNGGVVEFRMRIFAWATLRNGAWRRRKAMRVICDKVKIGFSNATATSGDLVGLPRQCDVSF